MKRIVFRKGKIDPSLLKKKFGTDEDGAVVTFIGTARKSSNGKRVKYLEYEIYQEMARREIQKILDSAQKKWPINRCLVVHRHGRVKIGEASILIAVSSPHREESFRAAEFIIDSIKKSVPIWKKEFYSDGSNWITDRA